MSVRPVAPIHPPLRFTRRQWLAAAGSAGLAVLQPNTSRAHRLANGVLHAGLPLADAPDLRPEEGLITG